MPFFKYLRQQENLFNQHVFYASNSSDMDLADYRLVQDKLRHNYNWDNNATRLRFIKNSIQELFIPFSNASFANGLSYHSFTNDLRTVIAYGVFGPIEACISCYYGYPTHALSMLISAGAKILFALACLVIDLSLFSLSLFTRTVSTFCHGINYLVAKTEPASLEYTA